VRLGLKRISVCLGTCEHGGFQYVSYCAPTRYA